MPKTAGENARDSLLAVGTDLMRRSGYSATSVDEICTAAGVTKGAFFHHFRSKEALAKECLCKWQEQMAELHRAAPYQSIEDPVAKVLAAIDFMAAMFDGADIHKSCLAGTTVQEVSESNPVLREAAQECFAKGERYFQTLLNAACRSRGLKLDTASLAELWMGTVQGSLLLAKASQDPAVIGRNLAHFKSYFQKLLEQEGAAQSAAPSLA
ncbi:MAG: TetR/AcrR family transcriptional regulator [Pirellulales bacterium]